MIFELIDSKQSCNSVFCDEGIVEYSSLQNPTHTWDYSPTFGDKQVELACLYAGTKNIEDSCSHELRERYISVRQKLKAYLKSFITAQINLDENCFFDLVPITFITEFFSVRLSIIKEIFETKKRPENYDFLYNLNKMLYEISQREVKIDTKSLSTIGDIKNVGKIKKKVKYNMYGTITGRLSTEHDSFPILSINKNLRSIVEPTNDFLLELDFNAAEPRVLLALAGKEQPSTDLHEWNKNNIFLGQSREAAKKNFLVWMYNETGTTTLPVHQEKKLRMFYDKEKLRKKYYDGSSVKNYYGRKILADKEHAMNYILQSTTSDIFLRNCINLNSFLENKKSFVKFLVHDSIVLDMSVEDKGLIKDICNIFSTTEFGKFVISKKVGKNYGDMKSA